MRVALAVLQGSTRMPSVTEDADRNAKGINLSGAIPHTHTVNQAMEMHTVNS